MGRMRFVAGFGSAFGFLSKHLHVRRAAPVSCSPLASAPPTLSSVERMPFVDACIRPQPALAPFSAPAGLNCSSCRLLTPLCAHRGAHAGQRGAHALRRRLRPGVHAPVPLSPGGGAGGPAGLHAGRLQDPQGGPAECVPSVPPVPAVHACCALLSLSCQPDCTPDGCEFRRERLADSAPAILAAPAMPAVSRTAL